MIVRFRSDDFRNFEFTLSPELGDAHNLGLIRSYLQAQIGSKALLLPSSLQDGATYVYTELKTQSTQTNRQRGKKRKQDWPPSGVKIFGKQKYLLIREAIVC